MASGTVVATASTPGRPFTFVRSTTVANLTKAAADTGFNLNFNLSLLPNVTELSSLFDQYRVDWFELNFLWQNTSSAAQYPTMYIAQDWDGVASAPTVYTDVFQYASMKVVAFDATHRIFSMRVVRPGINVTSGTASNAMFTRAPYIDLSDSTEPHYGPVLFVGQFNTAVNSGDIAYWFRAQITTRAQR